MNHHEVIIRIGPGGLVSYWEQDTPEVQALLEAVEALSTCDCVDEVCPASEMRDWRAQLSQGVIVKENGAVVILK